MLAEPLERLFPKQGAFRVIFAIEAPRLLGEGARPLGGPLGHGFARGIARVPHRLYRHDARQGLDRHASFLKTR